ncbi:[NiFe]-hydrogenase assembly chaperone HybE [Rubellimicrobium arenae]|uniref:[NiFe]-hydrogenase assembly chaperone HybE n=1 Tax=Rubellimicrobium arenae TaxID=2817372 RepID=UPI001B30D647|nr:[NiFe]-hydrogenase assembly chaperone HybE [Rubellimicrobium arenae]
MSGFEGSYLGSSAKIGPAAIMECKICWTRYDPAQGDVTRQVEPGTPFTDLPWDWSCPVCSSPKAQFLVHSDPGGPEEAEAAFLAERTRALVADFQEIWNGKMRDVPLVNKLLAIEAVGFRMWEGRPLGVLVSPWFMNLVILPGEGEDWSDLIPGTKEDVAFPSGDYEFIHNTREQTGGYMACSLFSAMGEFRTQAQAVDVAKAILPALFDPKNRVELPRREKPAQVAPTRRQLLGGRAQPQVA